ncbi:hypothetical protein [Bacillus pumilus]|uniref:hypothetical protein n=1 Tax=Bacillus pumilus TaxID=1408 RepID=UPI002112B0FA|nr:hypothetical protein [Bacillus pumilus]UUD44613.1 hypothetical protein NPA43_18945 [Bacillus pumilus]
MQKMTNFCKGRIKITGDQIPFFLAYCVNFHESDESDREGKVFTRIKGSNANFIQTSDISYKDTTKISLPFEAARGVDEKLLTHLSKQFKLTFEIEVHCLADLTDIRLLICEGQLHKEIKQYEKDEKIH